MFNLRKFVFFPEVIFKTPPKRHFKISQKWQFSRFKKMEVIFKLEGYFFKITSKDSWGGVGEGGLGFKGGSRHNQNRRNCQTVKNGHGCLLLMYIVGRATGGQVALRHCQNRHDPVKTAKTYSPLIKGVRFHPSLWRGWGSKSTWKQVDLDSPPP